MGLMGTGFQDDLTLASLSEDSDGTLMSGSQRQEQVRASTRAHNGVDEGLEGEVIFAEPADSPDSRSAFPRHAVRVAQRVPAVAPSFINGVGVVSADQVTAALMAAIRSGRDGWRSTDEGLPVFDYDPGGKVAPIEISLQPPSDGGALPAGVAEMMWTIVDAFNDRDTDVLNILQAHILRHRDTDGFIWITAKAILADRDIHPITKRSGLGRRTAGHRTDDIQQVAASMMRLQYLMVRVATLRHGRNKLASLLTRVVDVDMEGTDDGTLMAWHVTLPFLTRLFLQRSAAPEAMMLQQVLRYDQRNHSREKRIGDHILRAFRRSLGTTPPALSADEWRAILAVSTDAEPLVVRFVLKDLFAELALSLDLRNPERTRSSFEASLAQLKDHGIIGRWGYCSYMELPSRRWLETWLGCAIWVISPPRVREYYAQLLTAAKSSADQLHVSPPDVP